MKGLVLQRRAANKQGRRTERSSGFRLDRDHTMKGIFWRRTAFGGCCIQRAAEYTT